MTLRPAGTATYDRPTKGLLLEIGQAVYVVPAGRLAGLTSLKTRAIPVNRRYPGTSGRYLDIETIHILHRSRSGRALVLRTPNGIYTVSLAAVLDVMRERTLAAEVSQIVTDAAQISEDQAAP